MTQISFIVNSMPRDLTEFAFFLVVGFTAGSMGLIWLSQINTLNSQQNSGYLHKFNFFKLLNWKYWFYRKIKS